MEAVWPHLKRSPANRTKQNIHQLAALIKTRLKRMRYWPGLLDGYLAKTAPTSSRHDSNHESSLVARRRRTATQIATLGCDRGWRAVAEA